ncbi:MAG: ABC transporter permease subunit [Phycisphaeraceae bacterium]|nr:ABC transporter permease subunit [Phycisphaeraceae bacterium]
MSVIAAIAGREFRSFFRLPVGWIVIALFLLLTGAVFATAILAPGQPATLRPFFAIAGWLLLPVVPAISMRLFSDEIRTGTIEPLLTSPIRDGSLVLGKFLGATLFLLAMFLPTLAYPITLWSLSDPAPDLGPILAGYFSLALLGMLNLAIGTLASACTSSQTLSFLVALFVMLGMLLIPSFPAHSLPIPAQRALEFVSLTPRMSDFARGVIDTRHIAWFVALTGWLLVLSTLALQSRRWR